MHIVFLTHYFPPEVNAPATRTYEHCRRWVEAGHQVTVVTCAPNCPSGVVFEGYRNAWRSEEQVEGIDVIRVWTYVSANQGFLGRIVNYLSYMITATWCAIRLRRVDLFIATSPQFFCGWAGVLCHWLRRRPFVLEIRDIWPESIVTVGAMKRSPVIRTLEWLERRMYAAADHIVTVGAGYQRELLSRAVAESKISVIPNGVDLDRFKPREPDHELRGRWNGAGKFVCAYIGTVGMAHGLDVVLRAAHNAKQAGTNDLVFWIVGDGARREHLEAAAKKLELDNIVFTGMVCKELIPEVIASCDACLVHLRGTELFGTVIPSKIFEFMAMNVPIVMGVRGEAAKIVSDAQAGIVMTPESEKSLLASLETIQTKPAELRNGRDYVRQHFNRSQLATSMLENVIIRPGNKTPEICSYDHYVLPRADGSDRKDRAA